MKHVKAFEAKKEPKYKAVLKEKDRIDYVSDANMIRFIQANSDMEWNNICDYVRDEGICGEEGRTLWYKKDVMNETGKSEAYDWMRAFFFAHPWIEKVMFVFDD